MPFRTLSLDKRGPIDFLTLRRETHNKIYSALRGELPSACEAIEVVGAGGLGVVAGRRRDGRGSYKARQDDRASQRDHARVLRAGGTVDARHD